jgi:hypothetical protein
VAPAAGLSVPASARVAVQFMASLRTASTRSLSSVSLSYDRMRDGSHAVEEVVKALQLVRIQVARIDVTLASEDGDVGSVLRALLISSTVPDAASPVGEPSRVRKIASTMSASSTS